MEEIYSLTYFLNAIICLASLLLLMVRYLLTRDQAVQHMAGAMAIIASLVLAATGLHFLHQAPSGSFEAEISVLYTVTIILIFSGLVIIIKMHPARYKKFRIAHVLLIVFSILVLVPLFFMESQAIANNYAGFVLFLWYLPALYCSFLLSHPFKYTSNGIQDSSLERLNDKRTQFFAMLLVVAYCFELIQLIPPLRTITNMEPYHFILLVFSAIAVHFVLLSEKLCEPELQVHLVAVRSLDDLEELQILSPRERELLVHLHNGLDFDLIADRMFLSVKTVRNHASNIYTKLSCKNRVALMKKLQELLS